MLSRPCCDDLLRNWSYFAMHSKSSRGGCSPQHLHCQRAVQPTVLNVPPPSAKHTISNTQRAEEKSDESEVNFRLPEEGLHVPKVVCRTSNTNSPYLQQMAHNIIPNQHE